MTLLLEPTRQLPPAGNGLGGLRPLAAGLGRWQAAFFAGFGGLVKKRAFFAKKPSKSPTRVPKSVTDLTFSMTDLIKSETNLTFSVTDLIKSETNLTFSATNLIKSVTDLTFSMTDLIKSETDLTFSMTDLIKSETNLTFSTTDLIKSEMEIPLLEANSTGLKPDISDKMAQIVVLQADLTTAKTPRTPRVNFVKQLAGAGVTRLKLKEVRDSLHRLLHSLINFNAPILKTGNQGVGYASNNDSAAWRLLLPGG